MITEDYVSFETAKLLNERGFDEHTVMVYNQNGGFMPNGAIEDTYQSFYFAPTLQMAMKWLREVQGLDIDISIEYSPKKTYYYSILKKTAIRDIDCLHSETNFKSYEQACEAAIKYCLENLI